MSNEEVKIYRKLNRDEEFDTEQKQRAAMEKALEHQFNEIMKKIEDRQVITREEFTLYEKHEKFETYTKNYYTFQCPKCSDSYDVIMRSRTDDEKIIHVIYVEDDKIEKK